SALPARMTWVDLPERAGGRTRPHHCTAGVRRRSPARPGSHVIDHAADARLLGAVRAAKDVVALLDAVADDLAAAVGTLRRQRVDGALETVERLGPAARRHAEGLVVFVAANVTAGHDSTSSKGYAGCDTCSSVAPLRFLSLVSTARSPRE